MSAAAPSGEESLAEAVRVAVEAGTQEAQRLRTKVNRVLVTLDRVTGRLDEQIADRHEDDQQVKLARAYVHELEGLRSEFDALFERQHARLSKFNIVLFGRTGAGKSSLLEALSHGDGQSVSPGRSDHTRTVHTVLWEECALHDTPGIEGWGRPVDPDGRSGADAREELESTARAMAEIADVVVLVFDNENQKEGEFDKIAAWVRDFGKPAVAVLNCRNPPWRHPLHPYSQSVAQRRASSLPVAEHVRNIRDMLGRRALTDVPIVALNAQRAVFARAGATFRGPELQQSSFALMRERYGQSRLEELSNIRALEGLIAGAIARDAVGLRLGMLSEQLRTAVTAADCVLARLEQEVAAIVEELDKSIVELLLALGVGDPRGKLAKKVTELGSLRGAAFGARKQGELIEEFENLARARLTPMRSKARERVVKAVDRAIRDDVDVSIEHLIDQDKLRQAQEGAIREAAEIIRSRLDILARDLASDIQARLSTLGSIDTRAGRFNRAVGRVSDTIALISTVLAPFTGGLSAIFSVISGWFARRRRREAERERERAKREAREKMTSSIGETFDGAQAEVEEACRKMLKEARGQALPAVLENCMMLREFLAESEGARTTLRAMLRRLPANGVATTVLKDAARELEQMRFPGDSQAAVLLWQGEGWISEGLDAVPAQAPLVEIESESAQRSAARERFKASWEQRCVLPSPGSGREWLNLAGERLREDRAAGTPLAEMRRILDGPPRIVVCGDYSAGKSSLIRRLLLEAGVVVPESLTVAAGHETNQVNAYEYGAVLLVDTPGFQSGEHELAEIAAAAVRDAALVLYLFSPNLLTGSPAPLDSALLGDPRMGIAGKLDRTLFVINRCDELGVDPSESPDDYRRLCASKRRELAQVLASRGLDVSEDDPRLVTVASDPYCHVGKRRDVALHEARLAASWDGIDGLRDALAVAVPTLAVNGIDAAVLDGGGTRIGRLLEAARDEHQRLLAQRSALEGVRDRIGYELATGADQEKSSASVLEQRVLDELQSLLRDAASNDAGGVRALSAEQLESWYRQPRIERVVKEWRQGAVRDLKRWATAARENVDRRMHSASFVQAHPEGYGIDVSFLVKERVDQRESFEYSFTVVGEHLQHMGALTMESAMTLAELQQGSEILSAGLDMTGLGTAIRIGKMASDSHSEEKRDRQRLAALEAIDEQAKSFAHLQAYGEKDNPGPMAVLARLRRKLNHQHRSLERQIEGLCDDCQAAGARERRLEALLVSAQSGYAS